MIDGEIKYNDKDLPILFGPQTGKTLKKLYPEIEKEPTFKEITNEDLLFAWYLGNKSSPIDPDWDENIRYKQAAIQSLPNNHDKRNRYGSKEVPETVMLAVEKMATFSPRAREVSARIVQNSFHNILKMSQVDVDKDFMYTDKEGVDRIDWTARKQYIDSVKTTTEILPTLIKQLEDGFGIGRTKKEESKEKAIEKFHNQKKDNL